MLLVTVKDDEILSALNKYRNSKKLPEFIYNNNAACLASKVVFQLRDEACSSADDFNKAVSSETKLTDFHKHLSKCHIAYNSTVDGVILPACVPRLEPKFVVANYTHSHDLEYLNDRNYTGAGVGTVDDWVIIVLSTNTSTGNFSSGGYSLVVAGGGSIGHVMVALLGLLFLCC